MCIIFITQFPPKFPLKIGNFFGWANKRKRKKCKECKKWKNGKEWKEWEEWKECYIVAQREQFPGEIFLPLSRGMNHLFSPPSLAWCYVIYLFFPALYAKPFNENERKKNRGMQRMLRGINGGEVWLLRECRMSECLNVYSFFYSPLLGSGRETETIFICKGFFSSRPFSSFFFIYCHVK